MVRICVAVRESAQKAALEAAARAGAWADLVEVRADYIRDLDAPALVAAKPSPILFTLRSAVEGGEYRGAERTRIETLCRAARAGADYVDVEFSAYWQAVLDDTPRERVILSYHNFDETPANLEDLLDSMAATGAGVLKIVTRARRVSDNLRIAGLLGQARARGLRVLALAMGREGIPSRVLGPLWGSWATFASLPGGEPTADGQVPADALVDLYRVRQITAETGVYAVVGRPLGHSLSPAVHNGAFATDGRDGVFLPLEAESFQDFLDFDAFCPVRGAAVTIPYKEDAYRVARSLSVPAEATGAVNTLVRRQDAWHGDNTDVEGFLRPLRRRRHLSRARAVVLGAGGAARSVVYGLKSEGALVTVAARRPEKARELAERFGAEAVGWDQLPKLDWDLLVNTTPVGMHPATDETPVPAELHRGEWVYDLVYNPAETRLLREARERGCRTVGGLEMFVGQALRQQQAWFGAQPDEQALRGAVEQALGLRPARVSESV